MKAELGDAAKQFHCVTADLSSEHSCDQIQKGLLSADLWPDCLINNARDASYLRLKPNGTVARKNFMGELLMDIIALQTTME